jgi:hypothetical protein
MRIRSGTPVLYLSLVAASVVTVGLAGTFLYLMWRQGRATVGFTLFLTPFLAMGMLLGFFGTRGLVRLARYGRWELEVPDGGCVLGATTRVTLLPQRETRPTGEIQCRLRCVCSARTRVHGSQGRSGHAVHDTLWEEAWTVPASPIPPDLGLVLALRFPPGGLPTAVDGRTGSGIQWQLNVVVPTAAYTHEAMFEIPVRAS